MFTQSLNIIQQALSVYKRAIDVRSQNVANSQNENWALKEPIIVSDTYSGISLLEIRRRQNLALLNLRNEKLSRTETLTKRTENLGAIEDTLLELAGEEGVGDYVNNLFSAYEELMRDPSNEGAKQNLLYSAKALINTIKTRASQLSSIAQSLTYELTNYTNKVNELIQKIYKLNKEIAFAGVLNPDESKSLLDERDALIKELSRYVNVRYQEDELGRVKVYTSKGFVLVDFSESYRTLSFKNGRLIYEDGSDITQTITDGLIRGALDAIDDTNKALDTLRGLVSLIAKQEGELYDPNDPGFLALDTSQGIVPVFTVESDTDGKPKIETLQLAVSEEDLSSVKYESAHQMASQALTLWEKTTDAYRSAISELSSLKKTLDEELKTETALYESLERRIIYRQGVSVDEEMMEIMKLQRLYEAVAQILPRIDEMLKTLLSTV
ncbi:MAG: flagellar hook-associated protein FlgK [Aquificae bacterium]|nr:flagellar hook-associated protein FlgK [Aquificota bacterium]